VNEFDVQAGGNGELSQIRVDRTCPSPATNDFVADTPRGWCVDLVS